jgi:hypothetical protein
MLMNVREQHAVKGVFFLFKMGAIVKAAAKNTGRDVSNKFAFRIVTPAVEVNMRLHPVYAGMRECHGAINGNVFLNTRYHLIPLTRWRLSAD